MNHPIQHPLRSILAGIVVFLMVITGLPAGVQATATSAPELSASQVNVYFFHSFTCPHCIKQKPLMEDIARYNDDVTVHLIEVHENPQLWQDFRAERAISSGAVPRTFVGDISFVGFSESDGPLEYVPAYTGYVGYRNQIMAAIAEAAGHDLQLSEPPVTAPWRFPWWVLGLPLLYLSSRLYPGSFLQQESHRRYWWGGLGATVILSLFLLVSLTPDAVIKSLAQQLPFPWFVAMVALADGFNPCAFTVLIILLSLLTYTQRRRDMALVGGTFIATSAAMYFLFILLMIGVGSVLLEQYGAIFLLILGLGVAIAGLINIKDYVWFKQGLSLSLSTENQRTITQRASRIVRRLNQPGSDRLALVAAIGSTVALAVFVNVIELGCTAILPVVYMTTLVNYCAGASGSSPWLCYGLWTLFYAVLYVIPLGLILANFIYSFKSTRLSESQGRRLKLLGGLFMTFFGLIMIFRPELLLLS